MTYLIRGKNFEIGDRTKEKIEAVINPIINGIVYFKVPITIEKEIVNTKKKIIKLKKGLIFLATKDTYSIFITSTFYIKIKRS